MRFGVIALVAIISASAPLVARADEDAGAPAPEDKPAVAAAVAPVAKEEPAKKRGGVPAASAVAFSIGGIALLSFAGFGAIAKVDYDDYEARCGNRCAPSERDTVATSVTIADVSLVVAIVAAGVGTYFYLTRPTRSAAPAR